MELLLIITLVVSLLSLIGNAIIVGLLIRHYLRSRNDRATEAFADGFKAGIEQAIGLAVQMPEAFQGKGVVSLHDLEVIIREFRRKVGKLVDSIGG